MNEGWPAPLDQSGRQPGNFDTVEYSPVSADIQFRHEVAVDSLRTRHLKFIKSARQWFQWTETNGWQPVDTVQVYDCISQAFTEDNQPPRWLLHYLESETKQHRSSSSDNYWGLYSPPVLCVKSRNFHD
jgi:hypothetical protein